MQVVKMVFSRAFWRLAAEESEVFLLVLEWVLVLGMDCRYFLVSQHCFWFSKQTGIPCTASFAGRESCNTAGPRWQDGSRWSLWKWLRATRRLGFQGRFQGRFQELFLKILLLDSSILYLENLGKLISIQNLLLLFPILFVPSACPCHALKPLPGRSSPRRAKPTKPSEKAKGLDAEALEASGELGDQRLVCFWGRGYQVSWGSAKERAGWLLKCFL